MDRPFTVRTLADYLGISEEWIYRNKEDLSYVRFGTSIRFFQKDIDKFVERNRQCPEKEESQSIISKSQRGKKTSTSAGVPIAVLKDFQQERQMKKLRRVSSQTSPQTHK